MTAIGIDLGTTNSAIAHLDDFGKPAIIPNDLGENITPSVICFEPGNISYGSPAKELQGLGSFPVAAWFKRQMSDPGFAFHVDGIDYSAIELSSMLLKHIIQSAESRLKRPVSDVVITVPAYFRDAERQATIAAGEKAGVNVLQVINEPTAAAVAYGLDKSNDNQTILVYDLGGGTFDVTLLRIEKQQTRVLNSDGDHNLGGKDWDDRIIEYLATEFEQEFGCDPLEDAESVAELLVLAEEAKKKLTQFEKTTISLSHDGNRGRYTLTRDTFEELTKDLMERTASLTTHVLKAMKVAPKDLSGVLLVGGSTRMPMVKTFLETDLGARALQGINVDEAVALGAALVAAEREGDKNSSFFSLPGKKKTVDITNHSLGMIAVNTDNTAYINSIILPKNAQIPCTEQRPFQYRAKRNGDNDLEIFMTQGETEGPEDVTYIGRYVVKDVPWYQGKASVIDIQYEYDQSATVKVSATDRESGKALKILVDALPSDVPERFLKAPEIEHQAEPLTAYMAFDLSGSMSGDPIKEAKKAAISFLNNTDLSHCAIGIIAFSDRVKVTLSATQNGKKIQMAVSELEVGETGYCNRAHPFDELKKLLKNREGNKFGIVLADGVWSHQDNAIKAAKDCHQNDIEIIAIGFGGADESFLNDIASTSENAFFTSMEGLVETFTGIAQVLTESDPGTNISLKSEVKKSRKGLLSGLFQ